MLFSVQYLAGFCGIIIHTIHLRKELIMTEYLNIYIYFIIYSFLGWVCESIYCSVLDQKITNRGFLTSPFCPIYGFGALAILKFLTPFTDDYFTIFIAGILITSLLEYISSYLLELAFDTHWWDYSTYPFNINGRVCLQNSLLFGLLVVVLHFFIHPFVENLVTSANPNNLNILAMGFSILFAADFSHAVYTILGLNNKLLTLEELKIDLAMRSAEIARGLSLEAVTAKAKSLRGKKPSRPEFETVEDVYKAFYKKLTSLNFAERRLIRAFPRMENRKIPYVEAMRAYIEERRKQD